MNIYADDLTLGEICEANECSKAQILIDYVKIKASVSNMTVNHSKSSILTISFLNSEPNVLPTISDSLKVSKIKLLGIIITSDFKLEANTTSLKEGVMLGCRCSSLFQNIAPLQIFTSFIVWHFGLMAEQRSMLERVKKRALIIVSKQAKMLYEV